MLIYWIQTNQTVGHTYNATKPYNESESSLLCVGTLTILPDEMANLDAITVRSRKMKTQ